MSKFDGAHDRRWCWCPSSYLSGSIIHWQKHINIDMVCVQLHFRAWRTTRQTISTHQFMPFLHALVTNAVVHFYHQLVGNFPRSCWRTRIWQESLANYENISKILFNFRVTRSVNLFKSPKNCKRSWTIKRGKMHKRIYNDYTSAKNLNLKTNLLEPLKSHMETSKLSNQSWNSHETDKNPPKLSRMPIRMNEISRPDSQWSSVLWFKNCKIVCDVTESNITSKLCEHLSIRL